MLSDLKVGAWCELARLTARSGEGAAPFGSADGHRLAAEIRIVLPLDGCLEGVRIDLALAGRGLCLVVVLVGHEVYPAGSSLTPRATIPSDPSGSGR